MGSRPDNNCYCLSLDHFLDVDRKAVADLNPRVVLNFSTNISTLKTHLELKRGLSFLPLRLELYRSRCEKKQSKTEIAMNFAPELVFQYFLP